MIELTLELILTTIVLSFWFLFPIGMFLAISYKDNHTEQFVPAKKVVRKPQPQHAGRPRLA